MMMPLKTRQNITNNLDIKNFNCKSFKENKYRLCYRLEALFKKGNANRLFIEYTLVQYYNSTDINRIINNFSLWAYKNLSDSVFPNSYRAPSIKTADPMILNLFMYYLFYVEKVYIKNNSLYKLEGDVVKNNSKYLVTGERYLIASPQNTTNLLTNKRIGGNNLWSPVMYKGDGLVQSLNVSDDVPYLLSQFSTNILHIKIGHIFDTRNRITKTVKTPKTNSNYFGFKEEYACLNNIYYKNSRNNGYVNKIPFTGKLSKLYKLIFIILLYADICHDFGGTPNRLVSALQRTPKKPTITHFREFFLIPLKKFLADWLNYILDQAVGIDDLIIPNWIKTKELKYIRNSISLDTNPNINEDTIMSLFNYNKLEEFKRPFRAIRETYYDNTTDVIINEPVNSNIINPDQSVICNLSTFLDGQNLCNTTENYRYSGLPPGNNDESYDCGPNKLGNKSKMILNYRIHNADFFNALITLTCRGKNGCKTLKNNNIEMKLTVHTTQIILSKQKLTPGILSISNIVKLAYENIKNNQSGLYLLFKTCGDLFQAMDAVDNAHAGYPYMTGDRPSFAMEYFFKKTMGKSNKLSVLATDSLEAYSFNNKKRRSKRRKSPKKKSKKRRSKKRSKKKSKKRRSRRKR